MIPLVSRLVEKDSRLAGTPAIRRVQQLAALPDVEFVQHDGHSQAAVEVHSIWNARLWNMRRKKRRFVGLPALVRNLALLDASTRVKQVALRAGSTRGLLFYTSADNKPLGAVISVRTPKDEKRSMENWLFAMGQRPGKKVFSQIESGVKVSQGIAAFNR